MIFYLLTVFTMTLQWSFIAFSALNATTFILFIFYNCYVTQNLVFTDSNLPVKNIPYYDPSKGETTERFALEWWIYATDSLRVFPIGYSYFSLLMKMMFNINSFFLYVAPMGVMAVIELTKLIKFSTNIWMCSDYQFCRNYDPSESSVPNEQFKSVVGFCVGFLLLFVLYTLSYRLIYKTTKINNINSINQSPKPAPKKSNYLKLKKAQAYHFGNTKTPIVEDKKLPSASAGLGSPGPASIAKSFFDDV